MASSIDASLSARIQYQAHFAKTADIAVSITLHLIKVQRRDGVGVDIIDQCVRVRQISDGITRLAPTYFLGRVQSAACNAKVKR